MYMKRRNYGSPPKLRPPEPRQKILKKANDSKLKNWKSNINFGNVNDIKRNLTEKEEQDLLNEHYSTTNKMKTHSQYAYHLARIPNDMSEQSKTHFRLGNAPNDWKTTNKLPYFTQEQRKKAYQSSTDDIIDEEETHELINHFSYRNPWASSVRLGNNGEEMAKLSLSQETLQYQGDKWDRALTKNLYDINLIGTTHSNIRFGEGQINDTWKKTSVMPDHREYILRNKNKYHENKLNNLQMTSSNIRLGKVNDSTSKITETEDVLSRVKKLVNNNDLKRNKVKSNELKKDLQRSHFGIGDGRNINYETVNHLPDHYKKNQNELESRESILKILKESKEKNSRDSLNNLLGNKYRYLKTSNSLPEHKVLTSYGKEVRKREQERRKREMTKEHFQLGSNGYREWKKSSVLPKFSKNQMKDARGKLNEKVAKVIRTSSVPLGGGEYGNIQTVTQSSSQFNRNVSKDELKRTRDIYKYNKVAHHEAGNILGHDNHYKEREKANTMKLHSIESVKKINEEVNSGKNMFKSFANSTNVRLGDKREIEFETETTEQFKGRNDKINQKLDREDHRWLQKELRKSHFQIGRGPNHYKTTTGEAMINWYDGKLYRF